MRVRTRKLSSLLLAAALACAQSYYSAEDWAELRAPLAADTTSTCPQDVAPRCAPASPILEAARAAAESPPETTPHTVRFLETGDEALLARIHLIRAAQQSIDLQTFIWRADDVGGFLFQELVRAARRGVQVRLLGDAFMTIRDPKAMARGVREHENLAFKIYNPTFGQLETSKLSVVRAAVCCFSGVNERMHSKLMVVDGVVALVGGRNLADEYYDRDPVFTFKDLEILVWGPVVSKMAASFEEFWNWKYSVPAQHLVDVRTELARGAPFESILARDVGTSFGWVNERAGEVGFLRERYLDEALVVPGRVEFYADPPGKSELRAEGEDSPTLMGLKDAMGSATESITIQTPYLIFSKGALKFLRKRRKEHPGLELVASTNSLASADQFYTYAMTFRQKRTLIAGLGFRLFELKPQPGDVREMIPRYDALAMEEGSEGGLPPDAVDIDLEGPRVMIHSKALVVDERIAWVGTHNFDPRSVYFSTELAIALWDGEAARQLRAMILRHTEPQNSWAIAPTQRWPGWSQWNSAMEAFSVWVPIVDFWPFRYSQSYELRPGMDAVPYDHPEFYERYEPVGQFPGVKRSRGFRTRLFKTMAGSTAPLM